jgi:hypothetical protein
MLCLQNSLNRVQDGTICPQGASVANQRQFCGVDHKATIVANPESKRHPCHHDTGLGASGPASLGPPVADAVMLGLGDGGQDGEDQLRDPVPRHVAAQVDHVQADSVWSSNADRASWLRVA